MSHEEANQLEESAVSYAMVASGPPVPTHEVDAPERAVEVVVMWGQQVLHVSHLSEGEVFVAGESTGSGERGWLVGREALGHDRLPVVISGASGPALVIPKGGTGSVTIEEQTRSLAELRAEGRLVPCAELTEAHQYPLPPQASAQLDFAGFTFVVRPMAAGRRIGMGFAALMQATETRVLPYVGGAIAVAAMLATIFYFLPPAAASLSLDYLDGESRLAQYVITANEMLPEDTPEWLDERNNDEAEGGQGERHDGEEGQAGDEELTEQTNGRYSIEGPADNEDPHMARERIREQSRTAGVLGVLQSMTGSWDTPTSVYGREQALGSDPMSNLGAIMGDHLGANAGFGGLGMRGTGRGAGGTGQGTIGLGRFGTIGHGGLLDGDGYGRGAQGPMRDHQHRGPRLRPGPVDVAGSLSREVIRRVVNRHRNEVRHCYEQQLTQRPDLEGRVTVQFLIAPTGAVQSSMVVPARTTMSDARVPSCVATAVRRWSFPAPDNGGVVNVSYPFIFSTS